MLHEIGHYVLPHHEHTLYVCDDVGLSVATRLVMEKEANAFAAELLFLGDRFSVEANSRSTSASTVKQLATQYRASFEAAARRLVENNFRPCMLVVFKKDRQVETLDADVLPTWIVRYCTASPSFKTTYFDKVSGTVPPEAVAAVTRPGRDIADSFACQIGISGPTAREATSFHAEFFSNTYSIFCLLTPAK